MGDRRRPTDVPPLVRRCRARRRRHRARSRVRDLRAPTSSRRRRCWPPSYRTFVPDLPGMGRSMRRDQPLDVPGLAARADPLLRCRRGRAGRRSWATRSAARSSSRSPPTYPERIERAVLVSPAGGPNNRPLASGAPSDGARRTSRAAGDGADRRARLPALRHAAGPVLVPGDDPLPHARTASASRRADARGRRRPRPAGAHRSHRRPRRDAARSSSSRSRAPTRSTSAPRSWSPP